MVFLVLEEHLTEYSYFEYHWTKLFISRKRDYSDYEWDRCTYYMKFVLLYLVANAALTEVLRQLKQFTVRYILLQIYFCAGNTLI